MYALNSALIQMTMRRILASGDSLFNAALAEQRIGSKDLVWLHLLNRKKLQALDALPVSLFRVFYRTMDIGRSGLDDDIYQSATIKLLMIKEAVDFPILNQSNPLISIGFDMGGFDRFRREPFLRRLMLIQKGGFSLGIRCDLSSLELNASDKEAQLRDCLRIIIGDYRYYKANRPKHLGLIRDWNSELMGPEVIAENLLSEGVTPKLVAAHISLPDLVNSIHRKLRRLQTVMPKGGGRIGSHANAIARHPFHSLLFMVIYLMLANEPLIRINGFGFTRAFNEYRQICHYLEIMDDDMLDASDCWLLASGYRAQELSVEECKLCKQITIIDRRKPNGCPWCKM